MIRITAPFDNSPSHGYGYGPHPHHRTIFMGPHGRRVQGPCGGPRRAGGNPFGRSTQSHLRGGAAQGPPYGPSPSPYGPPYGPPRGLHSRGPPHIQPHIQMQQHCILPQKLDSDAAVVDDQLAFVEYELHQTEEACSQLKAQREMLLSKQHKLQEEKQCIADQREKEKRRYLDAEARCISAWNGPQAPLPDAVAIGAFEQSKSTRLIQGMDGRMYRVVAAVEDSLDDAHSSKKKAGTKQPQDHNTLHVYLKQEILKDQSPEKDRGADQSGKLKEQEPTAQSAPTSQQYPSVYFMQGPDGSLVQLIAPSVEDFGKMQPSISVDKKQATSNRHVDTEHRDAETEDKQKSEKEEQERAGERGGGHVEGATTKSNAFKQQEVKPVAAPSDKTVKQQQLICLMPGPDGCLYHVVAPAAEKHAVKKQPADEVDRKKAEACNTATDEAPTVSEGETTSAASFEAMLRAAFGAGTEELKVTEEGQHGDGGNQDKTDRAIRSDACDASKKEKAFKIGNVEVKRSTKKNDVDTEVKVVLDASSGDSKNVKPAAQATQASQQHDLTCLMPGPDGSLYHVVAPAAEKSVAKKQAPGLKQTKPVGQKQPAEVKSEKATTVHGAKDQKQTIEAMMCAAFAAAVKEMKLKEKEQRSEEGDSPVKSISNKKTCNASKEETLAPGASTSKEVTVANAAKKSEDDSKDKSVFDAGQNSKPGQPKKESKADSKISTIGEEIARQWILEGAQELSSKKSTADEIKRILINILNDTSSEEKGDKKKEEKESSNGASDSNESEDAKKDETVSAQGESYPKKDTGEADNGVQVEVVPEEEWEDVDCAGARSVGSSLSSSSSTPKTNGGESWMEPVEGDTSGKPGNNSIERSSPSAETA